MCFLIWAYIMFTGKLKSINIQFTIHVGFANTITRLTTAVGRSVACFVAVHCSKIFSSFLSISRFLCEKRPPPVQCCHLAGLLGSKLELANSVFTDVFGLNNYKFAHQRLRVSFSYRDTKIGLIRKEKKPLYTKTIYSKTVKYNDTGPEVGPSKMAAACYSLLLLASISERRCSIQSLYIDQWSKLRIFRHHVTSFCLLNDAFSILFLSPLLICCGSCRRQGILLIKLVSIFRNTLI